MKNKNNEKEVEIKTDSFQIKARQATIKELGKLEGETLFIKPGERVHKVVILEFDNGDVTKILSKIRDKDGLIYILARNRQPTGKEMVMKSDKWITEKDFDKLIAAIKKDRIVREVLNTGSENA